MPGPGGSTPGFTGIDSEYEVPKAPNWCWSPGWQLTEQPAWSLTSSAVALLSGRETTVLGSVDAHSFGSTSAPPRSGEADDSVASDSGGSSQP